MNTTSLRYAIPLAALAASSGRRGVNTVMLALGTQLIRIALPLLMVAAAAFAQTTNGRIVGSVTDPSGSAVAGVRVVARNTGTNITETVVSGETGGFVFPNLLIGAYEVTAEANGFKRYTQRAVELRVDQTVRVDIQLQLGDVAEQVTVEGGAPLIQTDQSSVGQVVENKTVVELPLNGRNFVRLGSLMPGTTQGAPGDGTRRTRQQGELLTANGARAEHNNFMLDGVENNSAIEGVAVIIPSVDAIQEFKVQTANYSAEFGRASGAVVNIAIKSGTNQLHGTAYEFLRNNALDAREFFALGVQPLRRNQFGFSLGGPLIKDKVFLFGNSEWMRERRTRTLGAVVPTAALRTGNFAGEPTVFDPLTLVGGQRTPFPGNLIPDNRIHPVSRKLLSRWPELNNPGDPARNYVQTFSDPVDQRQLHLRGDVRLTEKDQFMARISDVDSEQFSNGIALNGISTNLRPQGGVVSWTRLVSPTMVNEARFSAYLYNFESLPETVGQDFTTELGLPSFALNDITRQHPTISVRNYQGMAGIDGVVLRKEINYQWTDQLSWTRGMHTLKFGVDARRYQTNNFQPQTPAGQYSFIGPFTGQVNTQYTSGLPDFLLGLPQQQRILDPSTYDAQRLRNTRLSLFVQDDINVSPALTLNVGLRWERDGDWTEANDRWAYFDYATGETVYPKTLKLPVKLPFPHRFEDIRSMKRPTNKAFAPRFGFAWRPLGGNTTVVRGGYGISWSQPLAFLLLNSVLTPPPFLLRTDQVSSNTVPQLQFGNFGFTDSSQAVPRNPSYFTHQPSSFTNAYIQQWNFGVEREIAKAVAAKIFYVGSRGVHLERRYQGNAALPPGPGDLNARRRYPEYRGMTQQESSASSSYHSLQISGEKRFAQGLMFLAGYTWAKSLDDSSSWNPNSDSSPFAQNPLDLRAEKGRSAADLRHRFTLSFVYELPVRTSSALANLFVSGWQTSGILTLQTGFPTTVTVGGDIPNAGTGSTRANLNGAGNLPPGERTIDRWFNTAAFSRPLPFTFGTSGRTNIDRPGARSFDFSINKSFPIREGFRLQFRAEFFNFPNHPNFGGPATAVDNPATFGTIRSASSGREGQMALKLVF